MSISDFIPRQQCAKLSISDEVWASVRSLSNMFTTAIFLSQMKLYLDVDQSEGLKGWLIKRIKHKWNAFQTPQSFALFAEQNEAHIINKNFANSGRFSLGDLESTRSLPFLPLFFVRESMCVRLTFAGVFVYGVLSLSLAMAPPLEFRVFHISRTWFRNSLTWFHQL